MRLLQMVGEWEKAEELRRDRERRADEMRDLSLAVKTRLKFHELLGHHFEAMREAGIEWECSSTRVTLRANGRGMVLTFPTVGRWVMWGMLSFPLNTEEDVCSFFATVLTTLQIGGVEV